MGRQTDRLNALATLFIAQGVTSPPTAAAYDAFTPTYSRVDLRRVFGTVRRAFFRGVLAATYKDVNPTLANALVAQSVNEGAALNYQFNSNSFSDADAETLTYAATTLTYTALPGWITFTPSTRTFTGTAPAVTGNQVIGVRVTATDPFGNTTHGDFNITIVDLG